jgi:hypothetical protein
MKVSRKVWRRKHSRSSSISRRRLRNKKNNKNKSGYRKKNAKTQKGGKRGRGYKRMRAHTHKRGKRFHRGGAQCEDGGIKDTKKPGLEIDLKDYTLKSNVDQTNALQINDSHVTHYPHGYVKCFSHNTKSDEVDVYAIGFTNVPLAYTKEGLLTGSRVPGRFKVVIIEQKPNSRDVVHKTREPLRYFRVILTRQDNYTGKFSRWDPGMALETYFILYAGSRDGIILNLTDATKLQKIESNHKGEYYSFSYPENQKFFELLIEAAKVLAIYVEGLFTAEKDKSKAEAVVSSKKINEAKRKKDEAFEEIRKLKDNLEVKFDGQTEPIKFSDFKRELIELAQFNKQQIDKQTLDAETKKRRTDQIDKIVKVIVNAQYKLMKDSFIHLKVYGNYDRFYSRGRRLDNINKLKEQMNKLVDGTHDNEEILSLTDSLRHDESHDDELDIEQNQRLEQELTQPPVKNVDVLANAAEPALAPPPAATPPPYQEPSVVSGDATIDAALPGDALASSVNDADADAAALATSSGE